MGEFQAIGDEWMFGGDHVEVGVVGKLCSQAVAGFAGVSVADVVGKDEVIFFGVEELAFAKKFAGEFGADELSAAAGGAVQDQDGGILWGADGAVVDTQRWEGLAVVEVEVGHGVIGFGGLGIVRGSGGRG